MKKIGLFFAVSLLVFSLAACGKDNNNNTGQTTGNGTTQNDNGTTGTTNDTTNDNMDSTTNNGKTVENADEIADAVTSLDKVDHANVLKMDDSVYVGATLKEGTDSTQKLEDEIADKAKEASPNTAKVYVSTNPDFTKQIDDYSEKIRNGEPVEGLYDEISNAIKRMFPDAH